MGFAGFNVRVIVVAANGCEVAVAAVIDPNVTMRASRTLILTEGDKC